MVFGSSLWSIYSNIKETRMDIILDRALSSFFEKKPRYLEKLTTLSVYQKKLHLDFCVLINT